MAACEGGADGLFDMSGNVYEWTDACADSACLIRGGAFDVPSDNLTCDASHEMDGPSGHREDLGLRCCASPL
jgi:sulfatase modifying factor 1